MLGGGVGLLRKQYEREESAITALEHRDGVIARGKKTGGTLEISVHGIVGSSQFYSPNSML